MVDWEQAFTVALTGIISVFVTLGILSLAVYLSGLYFTGRYKEKAKEHGTNSF